MKIDWLKITVIGYLIFALMACTQVVNPNASNDVTPSPSDITSTAPVPPTQGETMIPSPAVSGTERLIEMAKEDLAQRLSIPITQINLVEITEVEWSDSSLGCPQPGMDYLQVITPGYLILLQVNAQTYEYHSNRDTYFVYCDNQSPPIIPKP